MQSLNSPSPSSTQRPLDRESAVWWDQLHATGPARRRAIEDLHDRLRIEAAFHIRQRVRGLPGFPRSDIDDLAVQAADDALVVLLRKLEQYRGDSQFLTWARRFAALEAPVSIRRRLGRDRVGISRDPDSAFGVADPAQSTHDVVETQELLETVSEAMVDELTTLQRTVLTAIAINGVTTETLADELHTTPGAIYKSLHDARVKLRLHLA